ncbi:DUF6516 family protein [Thermococcus sp.]|nr:DUF6516 family protein [Thermococcus sp.]
MFCEGYNYSFQWQKGEKLIIRWDNVSHHPTTVY